MNNINELLGQYGYKETLKIIEEYEVDPVKRHKQREKLYALYEEKEKPFINNILHSKKSFSESLNQYREIDNMMLNIIEEGHEKVYKELLKVENLLQRKYLLDVFDEANKRLQAKKKEL